MEKPLITYDELFGIVVDQLTNPIGGMEDIDTMDKMIDYHKDYFWNKSAIYHVGGNTNSIRLWKNMREVADEKLRHQLDILINSKMYDNWHDVPDSLGFAYALSRAMFLLPNPQLKTVLQSVVVN
jgi:hypothetical protein